MQSGFVLVAVMLAFKIVTSLPGPPGYKAGPPYAHTGGFGEPTCQECHSENPLNDSGGTLTLTGFPDTYVPGESYQIGIRLERPSMATGGFQLSSRFAAGGDEGKQAGSFEAVDDRVAIDTDRRSMLSFARHTEHEPSASESMAWTLRWMAPESASGPVTFSVASNAANGDDLPEGDFVYTAELLVEED